MNHHKLQHAYQLWYAHYPFKQADQAVAPFLGGCEADSKGKLKLARKALFLSIGEMAQRLQIRRSGYENLEKSEEQKNISLKTLMKVAQAMDCELVYAIRPKARKSFSQIIWCQLIESAEDHFRFAHYRKGAEAYVLAAIAKDRMNDAAFRREHKWSERLPRHARFCCE